MFLQIELLFDITAWYSERDCMKFCAIFFGTCCLSMIECVFDKHS